MLSASACAFHRRWSGSPAGGRGLFKLRFQRVMLLTTGLNQIVKAVGIFRRGQIADQIAVHLIVNGAARRAGMFKRIQTFVEPAHQHGLGRFSRYGTWI